MRTVICVPRKPDGGRRDMIWEFVRDWMAFHNELPIYEGYSDTEPWSMAAARNDAARKADKFGHWDVAIFQDADTLTHPKCLELAVHMAATQNKLIVAGDMRMTMDKVSSDEILSGGLWFPRPDGRHTKSNCDDNTCYAEPASGSVVIRRSLYDAIGGYPEFMVDWGFEDLVFMTCAHIWGDGEAWVPQSMLLHLWHEKSRLSEHSHRNYEIWQRLHEIAGMANKRDLAIAYLHSLGHTWPTVTP